MSSKAVLSARPPATQWRRVLPPMLGMAAIAVVSLATHLGAHSPYTLGWPAMGVDSRDAQIDGMHVNPDSIALRLIPLTEGFFLPCGIDIESANVSMPLHAFFVAIVLGVVRHYMIASLIANMLGLLLLVVAFTLTCAELALPPGAILLAGANALLLPWVVHYIGQPLHYTFAISLNFLVALAVIRLAQKGNRNPWAFGVLAATMTVNYDWYVIVSAIALFVLFVHRLERKLDYLKFAFAAAAPDLLWRRLMRYASGGAKINDLRGDQFFVPVKKAWLDIVKAPLHNALEPFVVSHIGLGMALRQSLGLIYWPLFAVVVFLVLRLRPSLKAHPWAWFPILMVLVYVAEQMGTAAFDWENNPRRALPVVFAFCVALTFAVAQTYGSRGWRTAFVALAVTSFVLSFSERLMKTPVIQELETGEAAREEPKWPMKMYAEHLTPKDMRFLPVDTPVESTHFEAKCVARKNGSLEPGRAGVEFWLSQLLLGGVLGCLLLILRRLRWLPRFAVAGLAAIYGISLIARLVVP
jgi:hypothetical protein